MSAVTTMPHHTRITRLHVLPHDERMIDMSGWVVSIVPWNQAEAVSAEYMDGDRVIITPDEWPALRDAIERMMTECRQPS